MIGLIVAVPAKFGCTLACLSGGIIGKDGGLPWSHKGDLKRFKEVTRGSVVIMGRKTWESMGCEELPDRTNLVVTRRISWSSTGRDTFRMLSLRSALSFAEADGKDAWLIGGAGIYAEGLVVADLLDVTFVPPWEVTGDTFFPQVDASKWEAETPACVEHPYNPRLVTRRWKRRL